MTNQHTDREFRILLDWFMVSDPWPLENGHEMMRTMLNNEAEERGYGGWVEAYHEFEVGE